MPDVANHCHPVLAEETFDGCYQAIQDSVEEGDRPEATDTIPSAVSVTASQRQE
jgi:hypothetical protein